MLNVLLIIKRLFFIVLLFFIIVFFSSNESMIEKNNYRARALAMVTILASELKSDNLELVKEELVADGEILGHKAERCSFDARIPENHYKVYFNKSIVSSDEKYWVVALEVYDGTCFMVMSDSAYETIYDGMSKVVGGFDVESYIIPYLFNKEEKVQ